jgi:hypothetical protein
MARDPVVVGPRATGTHRDRRWHDAALDGDGLRGGDSAPTACRQRGGACQLKERCDVIFTAIFLLTEGTAFAVAARAAQPPGSRLTAPFIAHSFGG